MNELKTFDNEKFGKVRVLTINSEPWFVGKDIADVLKYQNGSRDINRHTDEEDRLKTMIFDGKQNKETIVINESGLYSLIIGSKLPKAKEFKRWITSEVLPTIRKTGGYVSNDDMFVNNYLPFADEQTKALFKTTLCTMREQNKLIEEQRKAIDVMTPKADFFDTVTDSKDAIPMGDVAKVLDLGIGRNKLFALLRKKKILMSNNRPYQEYIDRGYFRVIETKFTLPSGDTSINIKTLVYQKGIAYIKKIVEG